MAVAVKNSADAGTANPFDRMPVLSLIGVVYVLASLAIVFELIPSLWRPAWDSMNLGPSGFASATLLGMVMLVAFVGLLVLGTNLLGSKAPEGTKAGIFFGVMGVVVVALFVRWISLWVEHFVFDREWLGPTGFTAGWVFTAAVGVLALAGLIKLIFSLGFERRLAAFERQGWFSTTSYKQQQGTKVRRGTILAILLLGAAGVYTLISHDVLGRAPKDWSLDIPFTGRVAIDDEGDVADVLDKRYPNRPPITSTERLIVSRYELRDINKAVDPAKYVKVDTTQLTLDETTFVNGQVVSKDEYNREVDRIASTNSGLIGNLDEQQAKDAVKKLLVARRPHTANGPTTFARVPLMPDLRYTIPLLIIALTLWIAWRVVNMPVFADFLIATEAELNKVSWTTKKRLYQDTIVVLAAVILLAAYLFTMDQAWSHLLSNKYIGVIVVNEDKSEANKSTDQKPW